MGDLRIEVRHAVQRDAAVSRIEQALSSDNKGAAMLGGMEFSRRGHVFTFSGKIKGFKIVGKMAVLEQEVQMVVRLPLAALAFKKRAKEYITSYLNDALTL